MTNKFLSILIIESEDNYADSLINSLLGNGNNPIRVTTIEEGYEKILSLPIGLVLINLEHFSEKVKYFVYNVHLRCNFHSPWIIGYVSDEVKIDKSYFNLNLTDVWLTGSFSFIREKIENWKNIHFEKTRISNFLQHLYPENVIRNFYEQNYPEPLKIDHAVFQ